MTTVLNFAIVALMPPLARKTISGLVRMIVTLGVMIFVPAWTLRYPQGWAFFALFTFSVCATSAYLWRYNRLLLERRINARPSDEKDPRQKVIHTMLGVLFPAEVIVSSLDYGQGWTHIPDAMVIAGDIFVALGFLIILLVLRENSFAGSTIQVVQGQKVTTTGPYALVRHPMYTGALFLLLGIPLALGSVWGLPIFIATAAIIGWRIIEEERLLTFELAGYGEYRETVRFRVMPGVW